eukprot:scaffold68108_cov56-Phaeocystis_antarctica.AAC.4
MPSMRVSQVRSPSPARLVGTSRACCSSSCSSTDESAAARNQLSRSTSPCSWVRARAKVRAKVGVGVGVGVRVRVLLGRLAVIDERLGHLEGGLPDAADHWQAEAPRGLARERVRLPRLGLAEEAALRDVAAEPEPPAIEREGRGAVEDDALGEALVVRQQQDDAPAQGEGQGRGWGSGLGSGLGVGLGVAGRRTCGSTAAAARSQTPDPCRPG